MALYANGHKVAPIIKIGGASKYGASINGMLGDPNQSGVLQYPTEQTSLELTGVVLIPENMFRYKFYELSNIIGVSLPDLLTIGNYGLQYAFYVASNTNGNIVSLSMPNLLSTGTYALTNAFYRLKLTNVEVNLPLLLSVLNNSFSYAFSGANIKSFTTNALTSITANSVFNYTFLNCLNNDLEIQFNNLESMSGNTIFSYAFNNTTLYKNKIGHPFPDLTTINGNNCFSNGFNYNKSNRIIFDKLQYIGNTASSTYQTFQSAFGNANMAYETGHTNDYDRRGLFFPALIQLGYANTNSNRIFSLVFVNALNHTLHFYDLTTVNNSSTTASYGQFAQCQAKRIYMPKVTSLGTNNQYCFYSSTSTEEIHFGIENEETIKALSGYASKFGATNATIYFDMVNHITVNGVSYFRDGADCDLDNWYFAWENPDLSTDIVYTTNFKDPAIGDSVYTKNGTTYTVSGSITAVS